MAQISYDIVHSVFSAGLGLWDSTAQGSHVIGDDDFPPPSKRRSHSSAAMEELRRRLSRLGISSGRDFTPAPPHKPRPLDVLVANGLIEDTRHGPSFRVIARHLPDTSHGSHLLGGWLAQKAATLARLGEDPRLSRLDPRQFLFLDTETTGLSGGAGVFAFLVGAAYFDDQDILQVHQFFLRDPAEEKAMLTVLDRFLAPPRALVTFNGCGFDIPLLASRFTLSRLPAPILSLPHLDLLSPARRLWKRRLPSCRLSSLEADILGLRRTREDVPGHLIPYLYRRYLETGDASDMHRVLYHNEQDILSMVSLAQVMARILEQPAHPDVMPDDRLSLARWYYRRGMLAESEAAYRIALEDNTDGQTRYEIVAGLAGLLKQTGRASEAVVLWEWLADLRMDVVGHEELAKHYEWRMRDPGHALAWTEAGIALIQTWRPGLRRTQALRSLEHRRARLLRKVGRQP